MSTDAEKILAADIRNLKKKVEAGKPLLPGERRLLEAQQAGRDVTEITFARNQIALAGILGIDRGTLADWLKLPGNPGAKADGRYEVRPWLVFAESRRDKEPQGSVGIPSAKAKQILLQNQKLEAQIAILNREYISLAETRQWLGEMILNFKRALLEIPSSLAPQVIGIEAAEAEAILKQSINNALGKLSDNPCGIDRH
jgi:hypothetical protein